MDKQSLLDQSAEDALKRLDYAALCGRAVLLTGATGLIGVNLSTALIRAGARVTAPKRGLPLVGSYDYVIHAAGYAQPARFLADPMGTITVNTSMLAELLRKLKSGGRLLFLSTSEVYSGNNRALHREDDIGATNPAHARGCYIESKRCGEAIIHAARELGQMAAIARVSSVYGPGARPKDARVMSQFIDAAITGEIALKDAGTARRVFLYVSDAVEMLLNILLHGEQPIYNVGGPVMIGNVNCEVSIITLARRIADAVKAKVTTPKIAGSNGHGLSGYKREMVLNGGAGLPGAPTHVGLDIGRYQREFDKQTWVSLDDGLRRTIEWHHLIAGAKAMVAA